MEPFHEGGAAQTTAARAKTATYPRTVTDPERSHLDASSIPAPEFAQQRPKIEPPLGGEVNHRLATGQRQPGFNAPHVETELPCPATKKSFDFTLDVMGVLAPFLVFGRCQSNDSTQRTRTLTEDRQGKEAHPPEKLPIRCLDEVMGIVSNLKRSGPAWYRRKIRVDDHGNQILNPRRDLDLGKRRAHGVGPF